MWNSISVVRGKRIDLFTVDASMQASQSCCKSTAAVSIPTPIYSQPHPRTRMATPPHLYSHTYAFRSTPTHLHEVDTEGHVGEDGIALAPQLRHRWRGVHVLGCGAGVHERRWFAKFIGSPDRTHTYTHTQCKRVGFSRAREWCS